MTTLKAFFTPGPNGPRLTAEQKQLVLRVIHHACDGDTAEERDVLNLARRVTADAVGRLPEDRSCHTCDFYVEATGECMHWNQQVPESNRESGCQQRQVVGTPF